MSDVRLLRLECGGGSRLRFLDIVERVERRVRMAIRASCAVSPREVLAVVDSKVDVVEGVVRRSVDNLLQRVSGNHVGIVDLNREVRELQGFPEKSDAYEDTPDVDRDEETEIRQPVHGEDEGEDVVR